MSDTNISILILDDEPIVTKRLQPALEKKGYHVESFTESTKALERIKEHQFDIIITDLKMEGISGMELLDEIKKLNPDAELIVITGFATMETAKESFKKGVFDFLAKPFKLSEIVDVVGKAVEHLKIKKSA